MCSSTKVPSAGAGETHWSLWGSRRSLSEVFVALYCGSLFVACITLDRFCIELQLTTESLALLGSAVMRLSHLFAFFVLLDFYSLATCAVECFTFSVVDLVSRCLFGRWH